MGFAHFSCTNKTQPNTNNNRIYTNFVIYKWKNPVTTFVKIMTAPA